MKKRNLYLERIVQLCESSDENEYKEWIKLINDIQKPVSKFVKILNIVCKSEITDIRYVEYFKYYSDKLVRIISDINSFFGKWVTESLNYSDYFEYYSDKRDIIRELFLSDVITFLEYVENISTNLNVQQSNINEYDEKCGQLLSIFPINKFVIKVPYFFNFGMRSSTTIIETVKNQSSKNYLSPLPPRVYEQREQNKSLPTPQAKKMLNSIPIDQKKAYNAWFGKKVGGKFIAAGAYGCVTAPPVKCIQHTKRTNNPLYDPETKVGKVFDRSSKADEEKRKQEIIQQIDPKGKWTIPLHMWCLVRDFSAKDEKNKCHLLQDSPTKRNKAYAQLIYEKGGKDLLKWVNRAKKDKWSDVRKRNIFVKMCKALRPIFVGLNDLHKNKYAHLDIKPGNILFDGNKLFIIDFGLMDRITEIYDLKNTEMIHILQYDYPYYPPEFKILGFRKESTDSTYHFSKFIKNFGFRSYQTKTSSRFANVKKQYDHFFSKLLKNGKFNDDYLQKIISPHTSKIDVYSLGEAFLEIHRMLVVNDSLFTIQMKHLLKKMVDINCFTRPSWEEIIDMYDSFKEESKNTRQKIY
jgi:serine/threonine protein kinase